MVQTLWYLHSDGIVHGDVNPYNVVFNSHNVAKLDGFFFTIDTSTEENSNAIPGTVEYIAPEGFSSAENDLLMDKSPLNSIFSYKVQ